MIRFIWQISSIALAIVSCMLLYRYSNSVINFQIGPMFDLPYANIISASHKSNIGLAGLLLGFGIFYVLGTAIADIVQTSVIVGDVKEIAARDSDMVLTPSAFLANFPTRGLLMRAARDYSKSIVWQAPDKKSKNRTVQLQSAKVYFLDSNLLASMNGNWLTKSAIATGLAYAGFKFLLELTNGLSNEAAPLLSIGFLFFSSVTLYFLSHGADRMRIMMMTRLARHIDALFGSPTNLLQNITKSPAPEHKVNSKLKLDDENIAVISDQIDQRISIQMDEISALAKNMAQASEKSIEKSGRAIASAKKVLTAAITETLNSQFAAASKKQQSALKRISDAQLKETKSLKTLLNDLTVQGDGTTKTLKGSSKAAKATELKKNSSAKATTKAPVNITSSAPKPSLSQKEIKELKEMLEASQTSLADLPHYKIN